MALGSSGAWKEVSPGWIDSVAIVVTIDVNGERFDRFRLEVRGSANYVGCSKLVVYGRMGVGTSPLGPQPSPDPEPAASPARPLAVWGDGAGSLLDFSSQLSGSYNGQPRRAVNLLQVTCS